MALYLRGLLHMSENKSPARLWREAQGIGVGELAIMLGLSRHSIQNTEAGYTATLPQSWRAGIERLGGDYDALAREYTAWREQETARLLQGR
jgi:DNA-binding XRE family transcriptional regulator